MGLVFLHPYIHTYWPLGHGQEGGMNWYFLTLILFQPLASMLLGFNTKML